MQLSAHELEKLTTPVQDFLRDAGASTYMVNIMRGLQRGQGVEYVAQLLTYTPNDLLRIPNMGGNTCMNLINLLAVNGLRVAALEEYKDELVDTMRKSFAPFLKREAEMTRGDLVSMGRIKASAFGKYLLSIEELPAKQHLGIYGAPKRADKPECLADWFQKYVSPAVQTHLSRTFEKSVIAGSTLEGKVGLAINPRPRVAI